MSEPLPTLSCDDVEALLPLVVDGALDAQRDPALFAHLADCDRCQDSLAAHDLIEVDLRQAVTVKPAIRLRARWPRFVPLTAAALLLIGIGVAVSAPAAKPAPVVALAAPARAPELVAKTHPAPAVAAAPASPVVASASTVAKAAPIDIEVEVVALPGSTPAHPHYLVRRGEQVLLVAPQAAEPGDARPASYSPNRY